MDRNADPHAISFESDLTEAQQIEHVVDDMLASDKTSIVFVPGDQENVMQAIV